MWREASWNWLGIQVIRCVCLCYVGGLVPKRDGQGADLRGDSGEPGIPIIGLPGYFPSSYMTCQRKP